MLQGLVGRQHVVVGVDDADVGRLLGHDTEAVVTRNSRKRVGNVGAAHTFCARCAVGIGSNQCKVSLPGRGTAREDALGHSVNGGV